MAIILDSALLANFWQLAGQCKFSSDKGRLQGSPMTALLTKLLHLQAAFRGWRVRQRIACALQRARRRLASPRTGTSSGNAAAADGLEDEYGLSAEAFMPGVTLVLHPIRYNMRFMQSLTLSGLQICPAGLLQHDGLGASHVQHHFGIAVMLLRYQFSRACQ